MHAIRKSDLKQFTPNAKSVCRIEEGNTNDYLTEPRAIEEFLKTVEGRYNDSVSALEEGKPDHEHVYAIAGFVAYVLTCSPTAMRINRGPLEGLLETTAKILDGLGMIPAPPAKLGGENLTQLLDSEKIEFKVDPKYPQAIGIGNILQRVASFGNFHWDVLINDHKDCPFFTSDFPVGNETTSDPRVLNRIIPLTPAIAIRIRPNLGISPDIATFEFGEFSIERHKLRRQEAIEINRSLVRAAEDLVFFNDDQPWIARFVERNRHFRVETENLKAPHPSGVFQWSRQRTMPFQRV